jgi:hypothetical protein
VARDRDVRNAIQAALVATNAFDSSPNGEGSVWIWGLPEEWGTGANAQAAAAIVPMSSRQEDLWDAAAAGGLVITSRVGIVLLYRHIDPQLRDEGAELLLDTAANALNGQSLAGLTFPQTAQIVQWDWQAPTVPERRINAIYSYQYIIEGWGEYDTTP